MRLNNPLNIRYHRRNRWLGLHPVSPSVRGFCHFTNAVYGYRAALLLLRNYIVRHGCDTPEKIIRRWAPPHENDTELYIACVCGRCRIGRDEKIGVEGEQMAYLLSAMTRQETGMRAVPAYLQSLRERYNI